MLGKDRVVSFDDLVLLAIQGGLILHIITKSLNECMLDMRSVDTGLDQLFTVEQLQCVAELLLDIDRGVQWLQLCLHKDRLTGLGNNGIGLRGHRQCHGLCRLSADRDSRHREFATVSWRNLDTPLMTL